jgi:hypothetical protein
MERSRKDIGMDVFLFHKFAFASKYHKQSGDGDAQ